MQNRRLPGHARSVRLNWSNWCSSTTTTITKSYLITLLLITITTILTNQEAGSVDQNSHDGHDEMLVLPKELDDTIELGLDRLKKLLDVYNLTESIEERYMKLRSMDPYGQAKNSVASVTQQLKALTQHYDDVRKLLARQSTREPAKRIFDNLYHQTKALYAELAENDILVDQVSFRQRTDQAEEALHLQESLKPDAAKITKQFKEDLMNIVADLVEEGLLPDQTPRFEEGERFHNRFPTIDREALDGLRQLLQKGDELAEKAADALMSKNDEGEDDDVDDVMSLDGELDDLLFKTIPAYVDQHRFNLSRILLIMITRLEQFEKRVKKLDVESSILNQQDEVMEKVYESMTAELQRFESAQAGAEKLYRKYYDWEELEKSEPPTADPKMTTPPPFMDLNLNNEMNEDQNTRDEL